MNADRRRRTSILANIDGSSATTRLSIPFRLLPFGALHVIHAPPTRLFLLDTPSAIVRSILSCPSDLANFRRYRHLPDPSSTIPDTDTPSTRPKPLVDPTTRCPSDPSRPLETPLMCIATFVLASLQSRCLCLAPRSTSLCFTSSRFACVRHSMAASWKRRRDGEVHMEEA